MAVAVPVTACAQAIAFKRLPRYSYATFKTDAPLETAVGPLPTPVSSATSPSIPPGRRQRRAR